MKPFRFARLILALLPLSLCLSALPPPATAQAANPAQSGLPPGAPPLSPAQKQKQQARMTRFYQDLRALGQNTTLSPVQKQQQYVGMKKQLDRDMLGLLTPTQRQAVIKQNLQVMKLRADFVKQHQSEITKSNQLNASYQKSFTPAQKQKMLALQQEAQAQAQKVQNDPKMAADTKNQTLAAIGRDTQRQVLALLTPAQRTQVKQYQAIQFKLGQELAAYGKAHGQP